MSLEVREQRDGFRELLLKMRGEWWWGRPAPRLAFSLLLSAWARSTSGWKGRFLGTGIEWAAAPVSQG